MRYIPVWTGHNLLLALCLYWAKARYLEAGAYAVSLTFPTQQGFLAWSDGEREEWIRYAPRLYHCIGSVSEPGMSEEVRAAIHDLVVDEDTIHGLTLSMNASTSYGEVMDVVDHCMHVDTVGFVIYPEGVWIWYHPRWP